MFPITVFTRTRYLYISYYDYTIINYAINSPWANIRTRAVIRKGLLISKMGSEGGRLFGQGLFGKIRYVAMFIHYNNGIHCEPLELVLDIHLHSKVNGPLQVRGDEEDEQNSGKL